MSYSELDGPRPKTALDDEYVKALSIINQQREEIDRLRAALSSAPPDLVSLRLVLKCAERACVDDNTDVALDYVREAIRHVDKLAPAPPVADTPEVLPPSGYKSPMQRHYETPEFKAAWAAGKAERDAASPVVAPAPVVDEATHLLWTGLVRYLDEQFGLALRPEHCLMIKSMLVNRAQPIDAPRPDRSEPIAAPAPVVETVTITLEQLASIEWALYVDAQRKCPACEALRRNDIHKPECWIAAALSPRETPDGGGR